MPDVPESAVDRAAAALCELHHLDPEWARVLARAALEAAAPLLADEIARKILAHMEEHIADPDTTRLTRVGYVNNRAARRHFRSAAQIAGMAFYTDEDIKRLAAQALERGDFIACNPPEVPGDRT